MDTITHTLFGLSLYGAYKNEQDTKSYNRTLFISTIGASQIPDIDIISQLWDKEGLYQMWHRGITHSLFLTPVWAFLFFALAWLLFRVKDKRLFYISWLAVFIHITSDLFNAWGTGYFEPFSNVRLTFGTIPIVDFIFWIVIISAFILAKRTKISSQKIYRTAWLVMAIHVIVQSLFGYFVYHQYEGKYHELALSANFIPFSFTVIGKVGETVDIIDTSLAGHDKIRYRLHSSEQSKLDVLFEKQPKAKTLYEWAPFVVIVDDETYLGLYDPRFYRKGQSFLFEYIEKRELQKK